ncbi:hypothetical protein BG006_003798 [Podila minutissima]|uniref:Oxidoreductase-like domain-containing protein n=1 Tax=Podila minutissima TaxID=64525 RepID=A0A9P5VRB0_9FUNG|nr:hypothetical protein BG006_003798 [Podila minutissima]
MIPSPRALRFITTLPRNHLYVACARKLTAARSLSSSATLRKNPITEEQDERYQIRLAAAKARVPNYAGWWTSILNEHRPPQTMPDPSLMLEADHVFQDAPAKIVTQGKGANMLSGAPPANTLPTTHGCAHCIYDIYEDDRHEYKEALAKVLKNIQAAGLPPPPPDVVPASGAQGGDTKDDDDMDPGMKAFLELERKLKG